MLFTTLGVDVHVEIFFWVVQIMYGVMSYLFILYIRGVIHSSSIFTGFGDFGVLAHSQLHKQCQK